MTRDEIESEFEELEMVWILDDEDRPAMRREAAFSTPILAVPVAEWRLDP